MKVKEIFNKGNLKKRIIVYEEEYKPNDLRYRVDVYQVGKRGHESLKEQIPFHNKVASLACAKIILNREGEI